MYQKGLFPFTPHLVLHSLTISNFESASAPHCLLGLTVFLLAEGTEGLTVQCSATPAALLGKSDNQPPIFPMAGSMGHQRESHQHLVFCAPQEPQRKWRGFMGFGQSTPAMVLCRPTSSTSCTALMQGLMQRSSDLNSWGVQCNSLVSTDGASWRPYCPQMSLSSSSGSCDIQQEWQNMTGIHVLSSQFKSIFTRSSSCNTLEQLKCRFLSVEALLRTSFKAPTC